ncbi:MAG TPA: hypothetical protein VKB88_03535 [Bryobacteraceae bacterium]|nr:hypothetical protein [Bryobacteraceae bacterium]
MPFIVRLSYRNDSLQVDCAKRIGRPDDAKLATYDHVFDYAGGRFFEFRPMGAGSGTGGMAQRER